MLGLVAATNVLRELRRLEGLGTVLDDERQIHSRLILDEISSGGLTDEELAVACASHSGEPGHVAAVERMLARAGLSPASLRCGAHAPMLRQPAQPAVGGESYSALHNNCSGKHAGFLCAACAMGADTDGSGTPLPMTMTRIAPQ